LPSSDVRPAALEAAALADVVETVVKAALGPVVGRLRALEGSAADLVALGAVSARLGPLEAAAAELAAVKVWLAGLDSRAAVAGPAGPAGADGLGFDDLTVDYDGERTLTVKFLRGERVKAFTVTLPIPIYRGVFCDGKAYERGDSVTWGGSTWLCNADTGKRPGDGDPAWTLAVKRGRDGARS
jgi:hypothetical protein